VKKYISTSFFLLLVSSYSYGGGIPVIDVTSIIQETIMAEESVQQTLNQIKQIENQIKQLENFEKEFKSMTGSYGMGSLLNGSAEKKALRVIPKNWRETLAMVNKGGSPGQYKALYSGIEEARKSQYFEADEIYVDGSEKEAERYEQEAENIYGIKGASIAMIETTEDRLKKSSDMSKSIDEKNANDPKAADDLRNRILIETNYLLSAVIQQLGVIGLGEASAMEARRNKETLDQWHFGGVER
jgi:hypothetical protein